MVRPNDEKSIATVFFAWLHPVVLSFRTSIGPRLLSRSTGDLNFDKIREWLTDCATNHTNCNGNQRNDRLQNSAELLLIDVLEQSLIDGNSRQTYVALSYVSGGAQAFHCVKSNVAAFQQMNGLLAPGFDLPLLYRDAMELVRKLGLRYLWIE